ncbi:MAG: pyk [Evtepia sp.]|nr:pyk [Evtepia sp.]
MRKTKIICTLGPATDAPGVLRDMMLCGMNVARFNFSHGTHPEHQKRLDELKQLREELGLPIAALLDTKGPEIRLKHFEHGNAILKEGQTFTLTTRAVIGNQEICGITYKDLPQDVDIGSRIMLDDGLIGMRVTDLTDTDIICQVDNGGPIKDRKGVNVPGIHLSMPYMSQQDKEDILFGIEQGFDFVAASFCRSEQDVLEIRRFIEENRGDMLIIAKIENQEGVDNIAAIMAVADGVMIARGDMGVEIDFTEIPVIQKEIISRAMANGKTVITATQMLESMMNNPRPTRAEITDVANAVYDGTSAVMLSGETAAGQYPVEAVRTMAAIANRTETDINYFGRMVKMATDAHLGISDATAHAACTTATDTNASAIITVSKSGATARRISKYRPETPIVACIMKPEIQRQLALSWGVTPILMPFAENTDEMIDFSVQAAKDVKLVEDGDIVVVTAGIPAGVSGTTNIMKVHLVGSCLITGVGVGNENAKGNLCICRNLGDIKSKFEQGDVLVIPQTNNEMLPYIRQAAAVITEEAGLSSHAAVVGLSTNKAVIIGALGATRILHDGIFVSVDCKRGIVQNLAQ